MSRSAGKTGPLVGSHFMTIREELENLAELGRKVLWEGAKEISFEDMGDPNPDQPARSNA